MTTTHLLYLHGFRSSPQSFKAQRMQALLAQRHPRVRFWCPQLPPSPAAAIERLRSGIRDWPAEGQAIVGSSLGGFYATVLGQERDCPVVVMNPAVDPSRDLAAYIGEQTAFHTPEERFYFRPEYVDELRALTPGALSRPQRFLAVIAKGDELLDWREMAARYAGAKIRLIDGSDHALSDFDQHLPAILEFLEPCD